MHHVDAHVPGLRDAQERVEVRPVPIHQASCLVHETRHLEEILLEQPERVGVREHETDDPVVQLRAQLCKVDVAARVGRYLHRLEASHAAGRRIGAMRGIGHEHAVAGVIIARNMPRAHDEDARELAMGARGGLERDGVKTSNLRDHGLESEHEPDGALRGDRILQGVKVRKTRNARGGLIHLRVVLHRAGSQGIETGIHAIVHVGKTQVVAHDLGLSDLGEVQACADEPRRNRRFGHVRGRQRHPFTARPGDIEEKRLRHCPPPKARRPKGRFPRGCSFPCSRAAFRPSSRDIPGRARSRR